MFKHWVLKSEPRMSKNAAWSGQFLRHGVQLMWNKQLISIACQQCNSLVYCGGVDEDLLKFTLFVGSSDWIRRATGMGLIVAKLLVADLNGLSSDHIHHTETLDERKCPQNGQPGWWLCNNHWLKPKSATFRQISVQFCHQRPFYEATRSRKIYMRESEKGAFHRILFIFGVL